MLFNEQLSGAIERRNKEEVRSLLDQGANVNAIIGLHENVPLFYAISKNDKEMIELLIKYGADVNIKDRYGRTPLNLALDDDILTTDLLFAFLTYGATPDEELCSKLRENSNYYNCLTAFKEITVMPHLGKLIQANIKRDKKESARAIAEYVNDEAKKQKLIEEFKTIKKKYGSDEQLSFISKCLLSVMEHFKELYLQEYKVLLLKKDAFGGIMYNIIDIDINNYPSYNFSITDLLNMQLACKDTYLKAKEHKKVFSEVKDRSNKLLNKIKNIFQSPNTSLTEAQPEAASSQSQSIE